MAEVMIIAGLLSISNRFIALHSHFLIEGNIRKCLYNQCSNSVLGRFQVILHKAD